MSKAVRDFKPWPVGQPLPPGALTWFYHPGLDDEFSLDPARFGPLASQGPDIAQPLTLDDAQQLRLNNPPAPQVVSNVLYAVEDNTWNGGQVNATVYVHGLDANTYAPVGFTRDPQGKYQQVRVDIVAGTFDTEAIRALDIALFGEVDPVTGQVPLLIGPGVTPDATIYEVLVP